MSVPVKRNLADREAFAALHAGVIACRRCPRLIGFCHKISQEKRAAFTDWDYWGKPVPGFGDENAWLWIIGLAPAAHGGNRTGRVFTGDRSGDFLYSALYQGGFASQPSSRSRDDGLCLRECYISAAIRCAPPGNKPLPQELANCARYLDREWGLLGHKRVILALGKIAWDAALALASRQGCAISSPRPAFAHAATSILSHTLTLIGSYHVSQQNTFTGRLTPAMFDKVLQSCRINTTEWGSASAPSSP